MKPVIPQHYVHYTSAYGLNVWQMLMFIFDNTKPHLTVVTNTGYIVPHSCYYKQIDK